MSTKRIEWLRAYDATQGYRVEESRYKKNSPEVEEFLEEIVAVCQRRGMILCAESPHEALEVIDLNDDDVANIFTAVDDRSSVRKMLSEADDRERWRKTLEQIASCELRADGDVVSKARKTLKDLNDE